MSRQILLEASDSRRRILQQSLPLTGGVMILLGVGVLVGSPGGSVMPGVLALVAGVGRIVAESGDG